MSDSPVLEITPSPSLSAAGLEELVAIEALCYPPATRYPPATVRRFLSLRGSLLVRARLGALLAGFQLSDLNSGQLITLDVRPECQRRGIGSAILRATLDQMRLADLPFAQCEISVDNRPSIILHENFGFQTLGRIPGYYEDGSDALVMILLLSAHNRPTPR